MTKVGIILVIISALFTPYMARACSCVGEKYQGFSSETETRILPRNAKGVLFTYYEFDPKRALKNTDFSIVDETTKKKIAAKVKKLDLDFAPPQKDSRRIQTIYRIEPANPFSQGHTYRFTFKKRDHFDSETKDTQTVSVSSKDLPIESLAKGSFRFIDKAEIRSLPVEEGGMCQRSIDALVQEIIYEFPPELKEFRDSILFFTAYSEDSKAFNVWLYKTSVCSRDPVGRSNHAFGHDLIYVPTDKEDIVQLKRGVKYSFKGTWIAPELEDKLYSSKEYPFTYSK